MAEKLVVLQHFDGLLYSVAGEYAAEYPSETSDAVVARNIRLALQEEHRRGPLLNQGDGLDRIVDQRHLTPFPDIYSKEIGSSGSMSDVPRFLGTRI